MMARTRLLGRGVFAAACSGACVDEYGWGYRGRCSKDYFGFITCECFSISGSTS